MSVLALLLALQIKHFLADFVFQTEFMVFGKAKRGWDWVNPLLLHSSVHAAFTFLILAAWLIAQARSPEATTSIVNLKPAFDLALIELVAHFVIDRVKAHPDLGGRFKFPTKMFWVALGLDQLAHQATYIWIVSRLV
jgi:hypothetical protein